MTVQEQQTEAKPALPAFVSCVPDDWNPLEDLEWQKVKQQADEGRRQIGLLVKIRMEAKRKGKS